ncbi:site-specific integrase [Mycolicibacterium smegmatis]|uniref:site-specific integrase n=1 Tax=Mycolicibacterium smegmatis TaxID=1772 RepID=UPI001EFA5360|nr:site-specific integrase [Mycolicibacterium smegmatis]MCP2625424.1 site-specific integrase [Mycolicibacterium smegmatis]MCP2626193.1 site-specific integrase [Mycolicibacterium smegmatis]ULN35274.1 site-specific integrase [Mycolicibacterium smegmatis]
MAGESAAGWSLHFYDFQRRFVSVDDVVPGLGDIADWAKRNGARDGTPFFLDPWGRADAVVNAYWRDPVLRRRATATVRRYALSLKVWLDFLHAVDVRWDHASRSEFAAFKEWRLSARENPQCVSAASFCVDRSAIRGFYLWAAEHQGVENPVRARAIATSWAGGQRVTLESTPSGMRRSDVKWLTPQAFRLWRNLGLRGFTGAGMPHPDWRGSTEDRDTAFVDGLFGTGLRIGEWSSVLTSEVPTPGSEGLTRSRVASACAKGGSGRTFWMRHRVSQQVDFYLHEGSRTAAVARAQAAGRYEQVVDSWIVERVRSDRRLDVVDEEGSRRVVSLDALDPLLRMKMFRRVRGGLEPMWLWLNHDGTPRPKHAWYKTFDRANARVAGALTHEHGAPLWCRPHMLRHSFALRWYCIATFVAWRRTGMLTAQEQRDFRNQLGDVWFLLATLLGHRSAEVTRNVYLEPFQALQVEELVALMDADDRQSLERLVATVGVGEPRVLTGHR